MTRRKYASGFRDLEELGVRFEEFRRSHRWREHLPEELWAAAAESAMRRGRVYSCHAEAHKKTEPNSRGRRSLICRGLGKD